MLIVALSVSDLVPEKHSDNNVFRVPQPPPLHRSDGRMAKSPMSHSTRLLSQAFALQPVSFCVTFAESEPYCHSILFVFLGVCWSFRDLQPTTINR